MIAGIRIKLKLAKDGKKWDRNRNNFDSVASHLKLLAVAHLLSPLAGTGNCLPQESEQGSGRVGVLLYHLACCWFDNCLRQKNNFFIIFSSSTASNKLPSCHWQRKQDCSKISVLGRRRTADLVLEASLNLKKKDYLWIIFNLWSSVFHFSHMI